MLVAAGGSGRLAGEFAPVAQRVCRRRGGAGRLEAKHRTARATSEGAVASAKSMARLRDSLPKAASSLVLVGAMLLPCSARSAYSSTVLNFAAPPCIAPRVVPATVCHLAPGRQGLFAGRQLLRQSRGLERAGTASRGSARAWRTSGVRNMLAMEPIEEMRDYSEDDALGRRLFVTGLASSIDDVRLYLAFEGFGRIVEAHVAKPGLGFVVFDDAPTADDALAAMEGSEVQGKEIKVKRARSFYIRKEEEARMRLQSRDMQREEQTKMYVSEQARRLKEAEEQAFQQSLEQNKGLAHHLTHFDALATRQAIKAQLAEEGLGPKLRGNIHDMQSVVESAAIGRVRMRAARRGAAYPGVAMQMQAEATQTQVLVGEDAEEEMRRRAAARQRARAPLSLDSVLAPDSDGRTLSAKDEERIRKQAMIEIMQEGDKLSKTESKKLPENINMAHLIRRRVEQIRRYEMLRDNKELLEQITFTTCNPTSRCLDADSEEEDENEDEEEALPPRDYSRARDSEWNVDDDDDDDVQVTQTEEELIALISAQSKV